MKIIFFAISLLMLAFSQGIAAPTKQPNFELPKLEDYCFYLEANSMDLPKTKIYGGGIGCRLYYNQHHGLDLNGAFFADRANKKVTVSVCNLIFPMEKRAQLNPYFGLGGQLEYTKVQPVSKVVDYFVDPPTFELTTEIKIILGSELRLTHKQHHFLQACYYPIKDTYVLSVGASF